MRFAFRFRPIAFAAALLVALAGILLGNWQQGRAAQKLALQARLQAHAAEAPLALLPDSAALAALEFRRVRLRGEFIAGWPILLANRPLGHRSGFYLAMPFRIAGSDAHVMVLRGWLPRAAQFEQFPVFTTPAGVVTLEGRIVASSGQVMELGAPPPLAPGAQVQNLAPQALAQASGLALRPFVVQQTSAAAAGDDMERDWPAPDAGIDRHRGYAFQWYALAAMAVLFYVMTGFRRGPRTD